MDGTRLPGAAVVKPQGELGPHMRTHLVSLACVVVLTAGAAGAAGGRLAPVPRTEAASTHGPFEMGACDTCHERSDPANPGAALGATADLCFECHDEFRSGKPVRMERALHPSVKGSCTACHNPHNSRQKKLRI